MEGGIVAAAEADTERSTTHGKSRLKIAAAGVTVALLLIILMSELQRNWAYLDSGGKPNSEAHLIWIAALAAVAAFAGGRYPVLGVWAGGTLAAVVAIGLVLGGPEDAFGSPGIADPQAVVRWAAHHVPIVVAAGSGLAAACVSRVRPRAGSAA